MFIVWGNPYSKQRLTDSMIAYRDGGIVLSGLNLHVSGWVTDPLVG